MPECVCFDHQHTQSHTHTYSHTHTQRHPPAVACITWLGSLRSADVDDARRAVVAVSRVYVYVCVCVCADKKKTAAAGTQQRLKQQRQQQRRQRLSNLNSFAIFSFIFVANKVDCSRGCFVWLVNTIHTIHTIQSIHCCYCYACCCECTQVSFAVCAVFSSLFKQSLPDRD